MLGALKKLFSGRGPADDWSAVAAWAEAGAHVFKRSREGDGFVVEATGSIPWRMEYGPPQRDYLQTRELRIRAELGLPGEMQMLVMARSLAELLERRMFESSIESDRTQIDQSSPVEQRWLALFQPVDLGRWRGLRQRFVAVASVAEQGSAWFGGGLAAALVGAGDTLLAADPPILLMIQRGRLQMRLQQAAVNEPVVAAAVSLFEVAATSAVGAMPRS